MESTEQTTRPGRAEASRPLLLAPLLIEQRALLRGGATTVLRSGMGETKSLVFARQLADGRTPAAVVVAGMGAGMRGLLPGDLVVATEVRHPDGSVYTCPWADSLAASLGEALGPGSVRIHTGPVATVRKLVRTAERGPLAEAGVVAADMESAFLLGGLAGRAGQPGCPWAVVRVVSDAPGHELMRPGIVRNGLRAYRSLKASGRALSAWIEEVSGGPGADSVPLPQPGGPGEADLGAAGGTAREQDGGGR